MRSKVVEAAFGPAHPNVARDLNTLGKAAHAAGDLGAARAYCERALDIRRTTLGEAHQSLTKGDTIRFVPSVLLGLVSAVVYL